MPQEIKISTATVFEAVLIIALLYILYLLRDLAVLLFVAFIAMAVLNPAVDFLEKHKLPRWFAVLLLYFFIVAALAIFLPLIVNPLIVESQNFIKGFPSFFDNFLKTIRVSFIDTGQWLNNQDLLLKFLEQLISAPLLLVKIGTEIFSGLVALVSVMVITFYLLLDGLRIKKFIALFFEKEKGTRFLAAVSVIEKKLGDWLRGELFLMLAVGTATYLGLILLGIKFALPLAVLAGLFEIIPNIGPVFSMFPPMIIGFAESPWKALGVLLLFLLVQQSENNFLVPQIMKGAVGLHPLYIILAIAIGGRLLGAAGVVLAVPLAVVVWVFFWEFFAKGKQANL